MPNFVSVQFDDIISSEVYFIERLKLCKYSATFYVNIRGTEYVMKVVSERRATISGIFLIFLVLWESPRVL